MNAAEEKQRQKELFLEQLRKAPIIQVACEKVGLSRATFYRWRKDDPEFGVAVDEALTSGVEMVNEMAESQLISAIKDKHMTAIIFWLKSRHDAYRNRVEVSKRIINDELSEEERDRVANIISLIEDHYE